MSARWISSFLGVGLLLLLTRCQSVGGYEDFSSRAQKPASPCHVLDAVKEDEAGLGVMTRVDVPGAKCFWIDQKEVTVAAYQRWLTAVAAEDVTWDSDFCRWKMTRSDPIHDPLDSCSARILPFDLVPFTANKPIRCVDFCDAEAFCSWRKKHLCHATDAFGVQEPRLTVREWALACSNDLSTVFPWGDDERPELCNVGQTSDSCITSSRAVCGVLPVGERSGCSTQNGVLDMLGNVAEWMYSCNFVDDSKPSPPWCMTRGGGYDDELQSCDAEHTISSDSREPSVGFRCCADLTPEEDTLVENSNEN
ncbi:MAG TPA: SUMF1/EgtB/PvdO family nonheme iron enzyme [Polyangiaceae bacterium]|nr:SUMF1/EgtB/PvdO family nonheme iron enzyme [Polyangiaceae bacterium]